MAKTTPTPIEGATAGTVRFLRVDAPSSDVATACAGELWAGRSEVPLDSLRADQVDALKKDARLKVEEFDREPPAAT